MSKLINCYHIKKKHRHPEDEEDEDDEEATKTTSTSIWTTTTTRLAPTNNETKSNDCDKNITNNNSLHCDHDHDGRSPVDSLRRPQRRRRRRRTTITTSTFKRGSGSTSLAHQLLALALMCLTIGCLHDDWLTWSRHKQQQQRQQHRPCMKNAQNPIIQIDYGDYYGTTFIKHQQPKYPQQQQQSPCDDYDDLSTNFARQQNKQQKMLLLFQLAEANVDANRLYEDLMMTYNRIVRPVHNNTDRVVVKLGLKLSQLMEVNLKNQMMTTNVWLNQEWIDYKLKWDPSEYGGIEDINLPAEQIWLPDIVLYNSAEGYFAVSIMTKAKVRYDGHVIWNPPAIFRSSCQIDITYFPFDSQNCHLKFGSWTFGTKIDLRHINDTEQSIEYGTDLSEYYQNVEWDIMRATAKRNVITYNCCPNDFYPDVTFNFTLRRKPLFYTVNLILPCIGITILSFLVFYLPSDSGEKVTLTISILVSLIFFLCVLIETIPSTSTAMPLLGKYLVFTMILITLSVCATVGVLNIHFRTPSTHDMSPWAKRWCIDILPKYLFMNVPQYQSQPSDSSPILPEQLIYSHNQAYQQLHQPTATDWTSLVQEAQRQQQQQQQQLSRPSSSLGLTKEQQLANGRPTMQLLDIGKLSHQSSTQSSFLPYLTSEAARRLQMQRSRSSERASSNNCDSSNNNSNLSNHIGMRPVVTCDTPQPSINAQIVGGRSAQTRRSSGSGGGGCSSKSDKKSGGPFWGFFSGGRKNSNDAQNTVAGSRVEMPQRGSSTNQAAAAAAAVGTVSGLVMAHDDAGSSSSTSTSSESEHDYRHHNHFQARASICSNNLWRIGPTRRCSLAAVASGPTNYTTFYRPLAQLANSGGQNTRGRHQVLSTISSGLARQSHMRQYHQQSSGDHDSAGSSGSPLMGGFKSAVGALASAAVTNLPIRTKAISQMHSDNQPQQSRFMPSLSGMPIGAVAARHHQVYPVPEVDGQEMRQLSSRNISQIGTVRQTSRLQPTNNSNNNLSGLVYSPQQQQLLLQQPTPPPPLPPDMYSHEPRRRLDAGQSHAPATNCSPSCGPSRQHQLFAPVATTTQQQQSHLMARQHSAGSSNQSGGHHTASFDTASSTTATTVMVLADRRLPPQPSQQQLLQQRQCMTRSRSSDHRLSQYALASAGMNSNQPLAQLVPTIGPTTDGQRHTIGRALGQVYIQQLQRQPTIRSMQPNSRMPHSVSGTMVRQGRSPHRSATIMPDNLATAATTNWFAQGATNEDCIRRSRSQTSLSHHQQRTIQAAASACRQCNQHQQEWADCERCQARPNSSCFPETIISDRGCNCSAQHQSVRSQVAIRPEQISSSSSSRHNNNNNNNNIGNRSPLTPLGFIKLISEVDKAIQNAMFIAQHIDNLDEFESVKENWKYIAMVIDRIFLIVFLFACIVGSAAIFMMVPWSHYTVDQPIDLQLVRSMSLNFTAGEPHPRSCRDDF